MTKLWFRQRNFFTNKGRILPPAAHIHGSQVCVQRQSFAVAL